MREKKKRIKKQSQRLRNAIRRKELKERSWSDTTIRQVIEESIMTSSVEQ